MYNIAAAGSVDREFWGPSKGQIGPFKGSEGGIDRDVFLQFYDFCFVCAKLIFLVRVLWVHPVKSVINNPTPLSGRGFPHICYMKLCLSQLYVFSCSKMETES